MSSPDQAGLEPPIEPASDAKLPELVKTAVRQFDRVRAAVLDRQSSKTAPLIPVASIAGRALVMVVAIMTFLAAITAGTVDLITSASQEWSSAVAQEATIQVRPRTGRDLEADVAQAAALARRAEGISDVRAYSREESQRLLDPWLGDTLALSDLPVPRLIVLTLGGGSAQSLDTLKTTLTAAVPTAALDDHRPWIKRLSTMANALVGIGLLILVLVLTATALAVGFATRGAMAGTKEIVSVLNLVGAQDRFIAGEFQKHFLKLGLEGGAIGGVLAILALYLAGGVGSSMGETPGGDQVTALFGSFSLGWSGHFVILCIVALVGLIAAIVSRYTVFSHLKTVQ